MTSWERRLILDASCFALNWNWPWGPGAGKARRAEKPPRNSPRHADLKLLGGPGTGQASKKVRTLIYPTELRHTHFTKVPPEVNLGSPSPRAETSETAAGTLKQGLEGSIIPPTQTIRRPLSFRVQLKCHCLCQSPSHQSKLTAPQVQSSRAKHPQQREI